MMARSLATSDEEAHPAGAQSPFPRIALAALVLLAASQYAWNAFGVPALTGYDAGGHAGYILSIVEEGRLPDPHSGWSTFHPPLYYLIGSAAWELLEPVGPTAIAAGLRAIGALAALGAGLVTYVLVRRRADWKVAWVATALVLFVPAGQMATAMIGNEALAAGLAALALPPLLALQRDPRSVRHAALAALFAGLAFATKYNGAFVVVACAVPFLRRDLDRRMLRALAAGVAVGAIVAGPVYTRNLLLTGTPFPVTRLGALVRSVEDANVLRPRGVLDYLWIDPACLLRPSIHHVAGGSTAEPRRNPAMTNVWGLAYASIWYDAQGHRIPLAYHRDGIYAGPLLVLLGFAPTGVMLLGFALALGEFARRRGRSDDGPLVVLFCVGLAAFVAFTWWAPSVVAVKGSYLLPLAVPGAVFFARGGRWLGARWRPWILGLGTAAALAAAAVFTHALVFPSPPAERMAHRYRLMGEFLPGAYIAEAADRLVLSP
jgi:4-amino-4-deoxy-L-arabinose transferase-like glycosyltransferase